MLGLAAHDAHLVGVRDEVAVREDGALRRARRAGRVDDDAGILLIEGRWQGRGSRQALVFLAHLADVVLRHAHVAAQGGERVDEVQRLVCQDVARAGVLDDVGNLTAAELEIDRHGDGAERDDGHVGVDVVRTVAGEDADAVADAHTGGVEAVTAGGDVLLQLAVGDAALVIDDGEGVWLPLIDQFMYKHSIPYSFLRASRPQVRRGPHRTGQFLFIIALILYQVINFVKA